MNRVFFSTPRNNFRSLKVAFGMLFFFFALSASAQGSSKKEDTEKGESLTETWVTEAPIPYLVEFTDVHPQGQEIPHEHLQILERLATMEWVREQRPYGLVVCTNNWIAHDEAGNAVFEGVKGLLVFFDGRSRHAW